MFLPQNLALQLWSTGYAKGTYNHNFPGGIQPQLFTIVVFTALGVVTSGIMPCLQTIVKYVLFKFSNLA